MKQRLALIPPLSLSDAVLEHDDGYYMYLPEMLKPEEGSNHPLRMSSRDNVYKRFIWRSRTDLAYTILDNGAFEGDMLGASQLLRLAEEIGVNEVIIPDVLGNAHGTLELLRKFASTRTARHRKDADGLRYMAVAQGVTIDELKRCIDGIAEHPYVQTIGLPKHLVETVGRQARNEMLTYIKGEFDRVHVHYLGQSPYWPEEIRYARTLAPDILRGIDTSMPYVCAYHGTTLNYGGLEKARRLVRPKRYFELEADKFDPILLAKNIETMKSWVHA